MTPAARSLLAYTLFALTALLVIAQFVVIVWSGSTEAPNVGAAIAAAAGLLLWAGVGSLIVARTGNRVGWVFLAIGVAAAVGASSQDYVGASHLGSSVATLPLTPWAAWLGNAGTSIAALLLPLIFLLFPTGTPPSPRWRWVARLWATGAALSAAWVLLRPGDVGGCIDPECPVVYTTPNPLGLPLPDAVVWLLLNLGTAALLTAAALAIASLFVRFRGSTGVERQQLKWLLLVGILIAAVFIAMIVLQLMLPADFDADRLDWLWAVFVLLIVVAMPISAAFAILRYRLYDIDFVISKTIVYGALAIAIGAVYVAIVVGIGELIGAGTESLGLRIAATALIAVGFEPVRGGLQRWANRLVYGRRATPYEVMAEFGNRVGSVPSADEVLSDMAEAAGTGVGAAATRVTVFLDGGARSVTSPEHAAIERPTIAVPVSHSGETIGELAVVKPPNDPLRPAERSLLEDLAGHAGLTLHNVRLTADLEAKADDLATQAEELRLSRERIVTARDAQRRRLEKELREGVGAELTAIGAELEADAEMISTDPGTAQASLRELGLRADRTLGELRDLARGIFPPLLADQGLIPAIEAHLRKIGIDSTLQAEPGLRKSRFDPGVENAVYFCCTQALQNVQRHAAGARAEVSIRAEGDELRFEIRDEGSGFDPAAAVEGEGMQIMGDRVAALDGELKVHSEPGRGTVVRGRVPARVLEVGR